MNNTNATSTAATSATGELMPLDRGVWIRARLRAPMEVVWARTQDPADHARWDLRFTRIIPESSEPSGTQAQGFRYETRLPLIGRWFAVEGWGAYQAHRIGVEASSSLRFGSEQKRSLIESGSGYWRYAVDGDRTLFETWYDYRVRGGAPGRLVDRWVFRPAMAWATAWSFDRLGRWVEDGTAPALSLRLGLIHGLGRLTTAFVFFYHGVVPKFLRPDQTEWDLVARSGLPPEAVMALGVLEVGLALWLLLRWGDGRPLVVAAGIMLILSLGLAATHPEVFLWAFNPLTLNLSVAVLAVLAWLAAEHAPRAGRTDWGWGPPGLFTKPS